MAGLILAGGAGKRWGGPKAWARMPDGRSFLETCVAALREAGADLVVATLPCGASDPEIADLVAAPLPRHDLDMFASLRVGLGKLLNAPTWSVLVILPVDHPLVSPQTIAALSAAGATAAVPTYAGKHGHPVALARSVVAAIADGSLEALNLREVVQSLRPVELAVDDPAVIANCNTPDSLARALQEVVGRTAPRRAGPTRPSTQKSKLKTQN